MIFRTITDKSTEATKSIRLFEKFSNKLRNIIISTKANDIINTLFNTPTIDKDVITIYNTAIIEATANGATMAEKQQIMESAMEDTNKATAQLIGAANGSIAKTQALVTYGNVDIFDNPDQLKSYYEIMEEISDVYGTLSSKRQAALSDLLFGSQNQKQGDALIRSFQSGQVQKAYEAAASSSGSAYKAQEDWMNSMQAKTTQFQAAFQSLSNTIFSDNLPKFFTDLGTAGVSALDNLIEKFGALNTLATIGGGFLGAKNLGQQNKTDAKLCGAQYIPRDEVGILV